MKKHKRSTSNMQKKKTIRVCPWFNKTEWEAVYLSLYSENIENKKWAVERVAAWKSRIHPTLHTAIDATTSIVRAMIQDNVQNSCQPTDISLMYSIALIRFINVITELDKTGKKRPIRVLAQKKNIPEWIVDLRHNATHASTPSLQMLRMGADFALNWLKEHYWEPEKAQISEMIPIQNEFPEEKIKESISNFQRYQYDHLYSNSNLQNKKIVLKAIQKMNRMLSSHRDQFLKIFCKPGYFLPAQHHLVWILTDKEKKFWFEDERLKLPHSLQRFWQPVINIISENKLISKFLELLLESQDNPDPLLQKIAMAWSNKILKDILGEDDSTERTVLEDESVNWTHLLASCLKSPCKYCPEILPKIVNHVQPPLPDVQKRHVMALVAVYLGAVTDEKPVFSEDMNKVYQLHDMEFSLDMNKTKEISGLVTKSISEGHWTLCQDINWKNCPIGDFPGGFNEEPSQSVEGPDTNQMNAEQTEKDGIGKDCLSKFQEETHFQDNKMQLEEFTMDINNSDPEKTLTCLPNKILIL